MTRHAAVEALLRRMASDRDATLYAMDVNTIRAALTVAAEAMREQFAAEWGEPYLQDIISAEDLVARLLGEEKP